MRPIPKSVTFELADACKMLLEEYREFGPHSREDGLYNWPGPDEEPVRLVDHYRDGRPVLRATARRFSRLFRPTYQIEPDAITTILNTHDERYRLRTLGVIAMPSPHYRHIFIVRYYRPVSDGLPLPDDSVVLERLARLYPDQMAALRREARLTAR